ncbi:MAG: histidinol dehydrogenase [Mariprofundales bacterium]
MLGINTNKNNINIRRLDSGQVDFWQDMDVLLARETDTGTQVQDVVADIINQVRDTGDEALCALTKKFDAWNCSPANIEISKKRLQQAWDEYISDDDRAALLMAKDRIGSYHQHQKPQDMQYDDDCGFVLGWRYTALQRVGLYVPGGKAAYPSSVLMNAIPAKVAGVDEIIMVVPTPNGELNELVLAAAHISQVDRVFVVGGAQAIAALAYGTEQIPVVDKIVGPGNKYVAAAKRQVFGTCGIDMIAGPSEIVVVADSSAAEQPAWLAADLLSQAEHDEAAQSIFISDDAELLDVVEQYIANILKTLPRRNIAEISLRDHGAFILVKDMQEAAELVNYIAPEHLELALNETDADKILPSIRNAGAIFIGHYTTEPLGDYIAGPNHVLPTNRTARFSSPLGVADFVKRSSIIRATTDGLCHVGKQAAHLAHQEGLQAHALSLELRLQHLKQVKPDRGMNNNDSD